MTTLVAYASKHGATEGIAERIGEKLRAAGLSADVRPVRGTADPSRYDAFVIGSAAYYGRWQKEAVDFVRRNRTLLADHPVWLFSSGPLGRATTDAQGRDLRVVAEPREIAEFRDSIAPRDHRIFFGALDHGRLGLTESLVALLPGGRNLLPEGDFRDWHEIGAWANGIAAALSGEPLAAR
ncbi:MAG: flavodoxin domain-containing protein [Candidatus Limnocylindrales bacterium]